MTVVVRTRMSPLETAGRLYGVGIMDSTDELRVRPVSRRPTYIVLEPTKGVTVVLGAGGPAEAYALADQRSQRAADARLVVG